MDPRRWIRDHDCWHFLSYTVQPFFRQSLGSLRMLGQRIRCQACQTIYQHFRKELANSVENNHPESTVDCSIVHYLGLDWQFHLGPIGPSSYSLDSTTLHPIGELPHGARAIDKLWISNTILKGWMTDCVECHTLCGTPLGWPDASTKLLLIDATAECLVEQENPARYLALSYVWGTERGSMLLNSTNLEALKQPGSLGSSKCALPRTIRDAMTFTLHMDYRYLWVDRLCIVQDDEVNKQTQISRMGAIYTHANLTIVAADGDDPQYGLRGVNGCLPRAKAPHTIVELSTHQQFVIRHNDYYLLNPKTYFERGWTFQEYNLSSRLIVFINNTVIWRCKEHERHEQLIAPLRSFPFLPLAMSDIDFSGPSLESYAHLVQEYSTRKLTSDKDGLAAFSGIIEVVSLQFPGCFVQGLPEFQFDTALLWQPNNPMKRRKTKWNSQCYLPSWSWVGWEGDLDLDLWENGIIPPRMEMQERSLKSLNIQPIVKWNKKKFDVMETQPIKNICYQYYKYCPWSSNRVQSHISDNTSSATCNTDREPCSIEQNSSALDLAGWIHCSFHFMDERVAPVRQRDERMPCYLHMSNKFQAYAYPFPVASYNTTRDMESFPLLEFRTARAFFYIGSVLVREKSNRPLDCMSVHLTDQSGTIVGAMRLNLKEVSYNIGQICEVIAISAGTVDLKSTHADHWLEEISNRDALLQIAKSHCRGSEIQQLDRLTASELKDSIGTYGFYNVLWIKREKKITFRQTLGRVFRDAWELHTPVEIDVVLG